MTAFVTDDNQKVEVWCTHEISCDQFGIVCWIFIGGLPALNGASHLIFLQIGIAFSCANPRSGSIFGRMAEQSLLTGYEPENLIEVCSEHTPTSFRGVTASAQTSMTLLPQSLRLILQRLEAEPLTSPLFTQEREVSATPFGVSEFQQAAARSSQQQQAFFKCGKSLANVKSGNESCPSVERSLLRGKRDVSSEVCHFLNMDKKEFCLGVRTFTNTLKKKQLFKVNVQLRKGLSEEKVAQKIVKKQRSCNEFAVSKRIESDI